MLMDSPHEAVLQHLDTMEWHLAIGQVWQTLGFLWGKAVFYPQLLGGREKSVSIMSMVYHHPEVTAFYRSNIEQARTKIVEEIGIGAYDHAWERGKKLSFDSAVSQVRTTLTSVASYQES